MTEETKVKMSRTKDGVLRLACRDDFFVKPSLRVVLLEPEIPPNTGNIGRLCCATGSALHLIKPLGFRIDEKAVRRAGLDYWQDVDLHVHESIDEFLGPVMPSKRCFFLTTRAAKPYWDADIQPGDALIFGKESTGLPNDLVDRYPEQCIHIPILPETVRSINLANAVSIVLFDAYRKLSAV